MKSFNSFITKTIIILFCVIIPIILSWPLIINLDSLLLPSYINSIDDEDYIDTRVVMNRVIDTKKDIMKGYWNDFFKYTEKGEISKSYMIFCLILMWTLGDNIVIAHNIHFLLSLFLAGFFAYLLGKELFKKELPAILSGFIYITSGFIFQCYYIGHSNNWQIQWIPLIFLFLERIISEKKIFKNAFFLGLALGIQVISGSYYTIFLTFLLPIYIIFRKRQVLIKKFFYESFIFAIVIAVLISSPFIMNRAQRINDDSHIRTIADNSKPNWTFDNLYELFNPNSKISISLISVILSIVALIIFLKSNNIEEKEVIKPFIPFLFLIPILMIGTASKFLPYYWLYKFWPFIKFLRVPLRMFPFFLISISMLNGYFFKNVTRNKSMKFKTLFFIIIIIIIFMTYTFISSSFINLHISKINI